MFRRLLIFSIVFSSLGLFSQAEELPLLASDAFEGDFSLWKTSDPATTQKTWKLIPIERQIPSENTATEKANHVLRTMGGSKYRPPHRSPLNIALLKETAVSDFELSVRVQNTNPNAGPHRDLCIFWGYQNSAHFYYVHLGAKPDPHSCQIFIVDGAPRTAITKKTSTGTPWDDGWHDVKVVRNTTSGSIEVFFDNMNEPVMTAIDKTFAWGRVGLGTFDDNGNFDDFQLRGIEVKPLPLEARLPGE